MDLSVFRQLATQFSWDASLQNTILLALLEDCPVVDQAALNDFMQAFSAELAPSPRVGVLSPEERAVQGQTSQRMQEMDSYFGGSLLLARMRNLEVPQRGETGCVNGDPRQIQYTLYVNPASWERLTALLDQPVPTEGVSSDEQLLGGYATTFEDGLAVGISIHTGENGPWVDAYAVLPYDRFPGQPHPSLKPTKDLRQVFRFAIPDGTERLVVLRPDE